MRRRFVVGDGNLIPLLVVFMLVQLTFSFVILFKGTAAFKLPSRRPAGRRSTSKVKTTRYFLFREHQRVHSELGISSDSPDDYASTVSIDDVIVTRRTTLASALSASFVHKNAAFAATTNGIAQKITPASAVTSDDNHLTATIPSLTIPLQYQPALSAYTVSYRVGGSKFGAIVDTGSPFLLVPRASQATCRPEYKWGCFRAEQSRPAPGLGFTTERFAGNEGLVEWREGTFSFDMMKDGHDRDTLGSKDGHTFSPSFSGLPAAVNTTTFSNSDAPMSSNAAASQSDLFPQPLMTFGVISESLMDGPGGIFLGLIKSTDRRIRPSFLGQSAVSAFSIDLRGGEGDSKVLTLFGSPTATASTSPFESFDSRTGLTVRLTEQNAIPLVRDLNKKYGDPTIHYVGMARSMSVNGYVLASALSPSQSPRQLNGMRKIYCIFDTGCSGMSVDPGLFEERYATARARREKSLWGMVDVELATDSGEIVTLRAKNPIVTPLGSERPWGKKLDGYLIVLGLSFLEGMKMTVGVDNDKIWFED